MMRCDVAHLENRLIPHHAFAFATVEDLMLRREHARAAYVADTVVTVALILRGFGARQMKVRGQHWADAFNLREIRRAHVKETGRNANS